VTTLEIKGELEKLENCFVGLTPVEKKVILWRFGLFTGEPKTLEAVGQIIGVNRERVRQIQNRALWRIRKNVKEDDQRRVSKAPSRPGLEA
jgi:DNA-directed RNA polymerase sigma subunit (sigma70/sigma32)